MTFLSLKENFTLCSNLHQTKHVVIIKFYCFLAYQNTTLAEEVKFGQNWNRFELNQKAKYTRSRLRKEGGGGPQKSLPAFQMLYSPNILVIYHQSTAMERQLRYSSFFNLLIRIYTQNLVYSFIEREDE